MQARYKYKNINLISRSASSKSSVTFASSPQSYHEVATPRHTSSPFEDSTFYQHNGFGASYDHEPSYQPHGNRSSSPTLQSSLCRSVYTASTSYQPSDIDLPSYNPYTSTPSSNIRHRMEGLSAVDYKNKWHNDIVKPIREILNKLSGACIECYCNAHTDWEEHATDDCPRYYNMQGTSELFKTWRASVVAPNGICFGCLISTVSVLVFVRDTYNYFCIETRRPYFCSREVVQRQRCPVETLLCIQGLQRHVEIDSTPRR